jgi:hypothetical protein
MLERHKLLPLNIEKIWNSISHKENPGQELHGISEISYD